MQIFKFQRRTCKLSFLFPPRRQSTPESLLEDHVRHGDSDNENKNGSENEVNDLSKTKEDKVLKLAKFYGLLYGGRQVYGSITSTLIAIGIGMLAEGKFLGALYLRLLANRKLNYRKIACRKKWRCEL